MKLAIAHAAWMSERASTLDRLLKQLPNAHVFSSQRREHATQWAYRAWEWAAAQDEPTCILNDDVTVCPGFWDAIHAMTEAVPDRIISLHTSAPQAEHVLDSAWVRCYWLTGPGYILNPHTARELLDYWSKVPWSFARSRNEDNIAIQYMWSVQEPAWNCIPALVTHDTKTKSSLGYDNHSLRTSCVPWETSSRPITSVDYWRRGAEDPPFVDNPWASTAALDRIRSVLKTEKACEMCWINVGLMRRGGVTICGSCLAECIGMVLNSTRAV